MTWRRVSQSRKATVGSTRDARHEGTPAAVNATMTNPAETPTYVLGSLALTPYSIAVNSLANAAAPATHTTTPINVSRTALPLICVTISRGRAPSAIRTPISRVRCATPYAIKP